MAAWVSVAIGLVVALVMIAVSLWWSFRQRRKDHKSASDKRNEPNKTVVTYSGNDHP